MEELEIIALRKVKELIQEELPKAGYVDGPWKIYTDRLNRLVNAEPISKEAFEHIRAEIMRVCEAELTDEQIVHLMGVKQVSSAAV